MKTKQKKHSHVLFRKLKTLLQLSESKFQTYQLTDIYVQSGILNGLRIIPVGQRVKVLSQKFGQTTTVKYGFDFHVNYSLETLLYKLYKFNVITIDQYVKLIRIYEGVKSL